MSFAEAPAQAPPARHDLDMLDYVPHPFGMGANLKIRTLYDAQRHGFNLRITCGGCGRSGIYHIGALLGWFRRGSKNPALEAAGGYFRCEECRHRGARLDLVAPYQAPDLPALKPSRYELKERARRERG